MSKPFRMRLQNCLILISQISFKIITDISYFKKAGVRIIILILDNKRRRGVTFENTFWYKFE